METQPDNKELSELLTSNYMLVSIMVRTWGATKKDDDATAEVLHNKGAEAGSAAVTKRLFGRKYEKLDEACARYNFIRNWYYANSVAWATSGATGGSTDRRGARLVGTMQVMDFLRDFAKLKGEAEISLQAFLDDYDRAVADAPRKLGAMFDPAAYPPRDIVRRKFDVSMTVNPLPSGADFSRTPIPPKLAEGLRLRYEERAKAQVDCAVGDLQERLLKELERISGQMTKVAAGEKTRLFKTLNSNMRTLTGLARSLAPLNPAMIPLADHIENELLAHNIEDLKDNAALARKIAEQAEVAATMIRGTPEEVAAQVADGVAEPVDLSMVGDASDLDFDMDSVFDASM